MLDAVVKDPQAILATILLDPDYQARHGDQAPRASHRHALFQSGTGAAPRGGHLFAPHERRDHDRVHVYASESLNKRVISSKDRAGFVVNALLIPYLLSAIRMLESGFASAEDIDTEMVVAVPPPRALALTDLIGLDTTLAVAEYLYESSGVPPRTTTAAIAHDPSRTLGRKSGQGFYAYKAT